MTAFGTTRAEIATALTGVSGVTGYAERPAAVKPGDAWPTLALAKRGPGLTVAVSWNITVLLAADEATATARTDALLLDLCAALDPVAYVDTVTPVAVATTAGDLLGLQITTRSE